MNVSPIPFLILALISLSLSGCERHAEAEPAHEHGKVVITSPSLQSVVLTQKYVCQIHSRRHIDIRALVGGYLDEVLIKEGQTVKQGDSMFKILKTLYQAELNAKLAEVKTAEVELEQSENLFNKEVVSQVDVALHKAKLKNAEAEAKRAEAELNFCDIKAPFDGIVDRLYEQQGSLIKEEDMLTTLSDNAVMWVYFNVPEANYLEYMSAHNRANQSEEIELKLANGQTFPHSGNIAAIEGQFNNEMGVIPFRADFENPEFLLRHGQTGNVLIHQTVPDAIVIPQRVTFEVLDQLYVFVIDDEGVVHQHPIEVEHELEDIFVVKGLDAKDKIVLEGVRQVHDGEKVEYEFQKPEEALADLKYHAE